MHRQQKAAFLFTRKAVCLALLAAFSAVGAQESDEVQRLIRPESTVSGGIGHVSGDSQRFGVYNGLNQEGTVGLLDLSVVRRDDATGRWWRLQGRDLGLSTRELSAEYEKQGDYRASIDFSQVPRVSPYGIHTGLQGIGSNNLSYPAPYANGTAAAAAPITLKTERQITKLGLSKSLTPSLEFRVNFQNDDKEGKRIFGRGTGGAMEFLAEPINSTIRQLDVVLNYTGERLQLSGGYYGSMYDNHNTALYITGSSPAGLNGGASPLTPISLPPDNYAHQLHLTGAYDFTRTTRGSFKASRTAAYQEDDFIPVPVGPAVGQNMSGRNDLGGKMDNTLVQLGLTSRPLQALSLLGNLRYEDRDDNTRIAQYTASSGTTTGFNEPRSLRIWSGKAEASYLLSNGVRLTGGVDREQKERTMAGVRIVGYREKTVEDSWRLEAKRSLVETLSGSLAYIHSERTGSAYRQLIQSNGVTPYPNNVNALVPAGGNLLQPIYLADRQRDRLRLALDWVPLEQLSVQFVAEGSDDDYGRGRATPDIGPRSGSTWLYTVDATYSLSDNWRLSAWYSRNETGMDQATIANANNAATVTLWSAKLRNAVDTGGLGVRGKARGNVEVGGDLVVSYDKSRYQLDREFGTGNVQSLPDITNRLTSLKLFSRYAMSKDLSLRLDYVFDHRKTNDWTWDGWVYTDGTWLEQRPEDKVHFIGLSASYSFR